jgi:hypothetical protein
MASRRPGALDLASSTRSFTICAATNCSLTIVVLGLRPKHVECTVSVYPVNDHQHALGLLDDGATFGYVLDGLGDLVLRAIGRAAVVIRNGAHLALHEDKPAVSQSPDGFYNEYLHVAGSLPGSGAGLYAECLPYWRSHQPEPDPSAARMKRVSKHRQIRPLLPESW